MEQINRHISDYCVLLAKIGDEKENLGSSRRILFLDLIAILFFAFVPFCFPSPVIRVILIAASLYFGFTMLICAAIQSGKLRQFKLDISLVENFFSGFDQERLKSALLQLQTLCGQDLSEPINSGLLRLRKLLWTRLAR